MNPLVDARTAFVNMTRLSSTEAIAQFNFPNTLRVFRGHFPDHPVVPGVHIIACALVVAEYLCAHALVVRGITLAKWTIAMAPNQTLSMRVTMMACAEGGWHLHATAECERGPCASCRLLVG